MKMLPEHYKHIETAVAENMERIPFSKYQENGLTAKRYRWDLVYSVVGLLPWFCKTLYSYLNDDHIDTALRRITKTN